MKIQARLSGTVWKDEHERSRGAPRSPHWIGFAISAPLTFVPSAGANLRFRCFNETDDWLILVVGSSVYDVWRQELEIRCEDVLLCQWADDGQSLGDVAAWMAKFGFTVDRRVYDEHVDYAIPPEVGAIPAPAWRKRRSRKRASRRKGELRRLEEYPPPFYMTEDGELAAIDDLESDEQDRLRRTTVVDEDD